MAIWFLLIYLVGAGSAFFLLMCVNPYGTGVLSRLSRFLQITLPAWASGLTDRVCGPRFAPAVTYYCSYIFKKPNPSFQIIYLLLSLGGFYIYVTYGFVFLPNPYISYSHVHYGSFLFALCLYSFYKTCSTRPGVITKNTIEKLQDLYPVDGLLYTVKECTTCHLPKPARSKHCSVCNICVARFDHHCIWMNSCVGLYNYKFFLLFLLAHSILCMYGGTLGLLIFMFQIKQQNLLTGVFRDSQGHRFRGSWNLVLQYIVGHQTAFFFVVVLCLMMGVVLGIFFVHHLWLVNQNLTTNERMKREELLAHLEARKTKFPEKKDEVEAEIKKLAGNPYNKGFYANLREIVLAY